MPLLILLDMHNQSLWNWFIVEESAVSLIRSDIHNHPGAMRITYSVQKVGLKRADLEEKEYRTILIALSEAEFHL